MSANLPHDVFVLPPTVRAMAIDPFYKGFAFALFEDGPTLIDWGLKHTRSKVNDRDTTLREVKALLDHYQPTHMVMEDIATMSPFRRNRTENLFHELHLMLSYMYPNISVHFLSRDQLREAFGVTNKQFIATCLTEMFPELSPRLPPLRKAWMSEDLRMNIFDAAALALTWFLFQQNTPPSLDDGFLA